MKKYKHIFFDLDRTLWDFETNSKIAFAQLYEKYGLQTKITSPEALFLCYYKHNEHLWDLIRKGKVSKEELRSNRFIWTLEDFGIDDKEFARQLGDDYLDLCPTLPHLVPDAMDVIKALHHQQLHIITNGFPDVQHVKMECSGLLPYFNQVITSEGAGCPKPDKQIFLYAVEAAHAVMHECLMVGDGLNVDVIGAKNAGMDQVFFNRESIIHSEDITYEIQHLQQLLTIPGIISDRI